MAKYAILIYDDPAVYANMSPEGWGALVDAHSTFVKQVFELGGSMAGGEALAPTTTATTIKGAGTVTDGPFVETKEAFGGFYVVEARDLDHAVEIANDTQYGLAGYVSGADLDTAREVARKIRAGWVTINHAFDLNAPFGGYKRSGNGREWSDFGFHEYLEVKSTLGYAPDKA